MSFDRVLIILQHAEASARDDLRSEVLFGVENAEGCADASFDVLVDTADEGDACLKWDDYEVSVWKRAYAAELRALVRHTAAVAKVSP